MHYAKFIRIVLLTFPTYVSSGKELDLLHARILKIAFWNMFMFSCVQRFFAKQAIKSWLPLFANNSFYFLCLLQMMAQPKGEWI